MFYRIIFLKIIGSICQIINIFPNYTNDNAYINEALYDVGNITLSKWLEQSYNNQNIPGSLSDDGFLSPAPSFLDQSLPSFVWSMNENVEGRQVFLKVHDARKIQKGKMLK